MFSRKTGWIAEKHGVLKQGYFSWKCKIKCCKNTRNQSESGTDQEKAFSRYKGNSRLFGAAHLNSNPDQGVVLFSINPALFEHLLVHGFILWFHETRPQEKFLLILVRRFRYHYPLVLSNYQLVIILIIKTEPNFFNSLIQLNVSCFARYYFWGQFLRIFFYA